MTYVPHEDDPELQDLALQYIDAAGNDDEAALDIAMTAYSAAVDRRRDELQQRLARLEWEPSAVRLDAAEAAGVDVASLLEPFTDDAIAALREIAKEAPDGDARANARRLLREYGLDDDDDHA